MRSQIAKLHEVVQRRLYKCQERAVLLGSNAPPELLIEIEDLETKLHQLEQQLTEASAVTQPPPVLLVTSWHGLWDLSNPAQLQAYQLLHETLLQVKLDDERVIPTFSELRHDYRRHDSEAKLPTTIVIFLDLVEPGPTIVAQIQQARNWFPAAIFVLYASVAEYQQLRHTVSAEWASRFEHYYKLHKHPSLQFATEVRHLIDRARTSQR